MDIHPILSQHISIMSRLYPLFIGQNLQCSSIFNLVQKNVGLRFSIAKYKPTAIASGAYNCSIHVNGNFRILKWRCCTI